MFIIVTIFRYQARSEDFFKGGLERCLMCMYAYINEQAGKTRGSGEMLPQEIFRN